MGPGIEHLKLASVSYFAAMVVAFFLFAGRGQTLSSGVAGLLTLVVRLIPAWLFPFAAGFDAESYRMVGDTVLAGGDVYAASGLELRYPYLPGWDLIEAAGELLAPADPAVFLGLMKVPATVADVAITLLLHRSVGARAALAHALSPISVAVTAYHGQFDALPALAVLVAILATRPAVAAAALGLGIWIKTWPALFLATFLGRFSTPRALVWGAAAVGTAAVLAAVAGWLTHADAGLVVRAVLSYGSTPDWGPWAVPRGGNTYLPVGTPYELPLVFSILPLLIAWVGYRLLLRRRDPRRAVLGFIVLFFVLTPAGGIQYLAWIGPIALVAGEERWFRRWTLWSLPYLVLGYFGVHYLQLITTPLSFWRLSSLSSWFVLVLWVSYLFRQQVVARGDPAEGRRGAVPVCVASCS